MEEQTGLVEAEWNGARYEAYVDREYDVAVVLAGTAPQHSDDVHAHELSRMDDDGCCVALDATT